MLALALLLVAPVDSSAAQSARRRKLSPLVASENVVVRDRPVVVRVPVPPEILAELKDPALDPKAEYSIRLHIILPADRATLVHGFARRWATVWTSLAHPQALGYFVILAQTMEPGHPPRQAGGLFCMTRAQLRRAVGKRDYFPLTLVQVDDNDADDQSQFAPLRGVTLHIERIYLEK